MSLSCFSQENIDRALLCGAWKADTAYSVIGKKSYVILKSPKAYDTLERWDFIIFSEKNKVVRIDFPYGNRLLFIADFDGNKVATHCELPNGLRMSENFVVNTVTEQSLALTKSHKQDNAIEIVYRIYNKVDSIETTKAYYDRKMLEQSRLRKVRRDSILSQIIIPESAIAPSFPGGPNNFNKLLQANLPCSDYAELFRLNGKVEIGFKINKQGKMIDFVTVNTPYKTLSESAVKALEKLSNQVKWSPATINGSPIEVFQVRVIEIDCSKSK